MEDNWYHFCSYSNFGSVTCIDDEDLPYHRLEQFQAPKHPIPYGFGQITFHKTNTSNDTANLFYTSPANERDFFVVVVANQEGLDEYQLTSVF